MENETKKYTLYDMDTRVKELTFIQDVISRLSARQQDMKNFCLIALGSFTALVVSKELNLITLICSLILQTIVIYSFLKMDKSFLNTERLYRMWYDFICWKRSETCQWLFELNPKNIKEVLHEESSVFTEFNPQNINQKNWSLSIYHRLIIGVVSIHLLLIISVIYQPGLQRILSIC